MFMQLVHILHVHLLRLALQCHAFIWYPDLLVMDVTLSVLYDWDLRSAGVRLIGCISHIVINALRFHCKRVCVCL